LRLDFSDEDSDFSQQIIRSGSDLDEEEEEFRVLSTSARIITLVRVLDTPNFPILKPTKVIKRPVKKREKKATTKVADKKDRKGPKGNKTIAKIASTLCSSLIVQHTFKPAKIADDEFEDISAIKAQMQTL
jgi:hypothetical protein